MTPRLMLLGVLGAAVLGACGDSGSPSGPTRSFIMGFSTIPPRNDSTVLLSTLTLSAQHSDAGLIQLSIPWTILLADTAAATEVRIVRLPLVNYYRGLGKRIVVALDVTNGLDRSAEDPALVAAGKSITDTVVQRLYREYVNAVDSILHPEYLSLAAETNLIRFLALPAVYTAVVAMTDSARRDLEARNSAAKLMISVQVELAWGRLQGGSTFVGIAQDRTDFPYIDALGLSSYPYLGGFALPEDIPTDYYSRLVTGAPLPEVVLEGGWPSVAVGSVTSTPAMQVRYIGRQAMLLDSAHAAGLFQITFTDLDLVAEPPPPGSGLYLFASNGLVDTALVPKPALATWDSVLARRLTQ